MTQKQLKINRLFRKGASKPYNKPSKPVHHKPEEDFEELNDEIKQLEEKLRDKQNEQFQIQRNRYRHKLSVPKKTNDDAFVRPQKIILKNSVDSLSNKMEMMSMVTGVEVQSYVAGDHFCVVFHMQHPTQHRVKHGLRIHMKGGSNAISSSNLPMGFNLPAVLDGYDNVKKPECLGAIRKALMAYYDRLEQFQALKKYVKTEVELFKSLDGSHIEITLNVQSDRETEEEQEQYSMVVQLYYRVYDMKPKTYTLLYSDIPEEVSEGVHQQCAVFKKLPLRKAFKDAFVSGYGQYKLVQQQMDEEARPRPRRPPHGHNDDTFRPEDCSDGEEDE